MWYLVLTGVVVMAGLYLLKAANEVPEDQARKLIHQGAVILDVRTEAEFQSASIAGVTNAPLDRFESLLPGLVPQKDRPVLLHCRSGTRSGMALKTAVKLGYTNVYNLGSFERARKIITEK
jgi:phage shock protein E